MARYGVLIAFLIGTSFCLEALGKYILFYHLYRTPVITYINSVAKCKFSYKMDPSYVRVEMPLL